MGPNGLCSTCKLPCDGGSNYVYFLGLLVDYCVSWLCPVVCHLPALPFSFVHKVIDDFRETGFLIVMWDILSILLFIPVIQLEWECIETCGQIRIVEAFFLLITSRCLFNHIVPKLIFRDHPLWATGITSPLAVCLRNVYFQGVCIANLHLQLSLLLITLLWV